jgi:hypothetical protein
MLGQNASDAGLNTREEMHRSLREILDKIRVEICDRFSQLRELELLWFSVQCRISSKPVRPSKSLTFTELKNECTHLAPQYSKDLNGLKQHLDYTRSLSLSAKKKKKTKQNGGETGLYFKGTARIHFMYGMGSV